MNYTTVPKYVVCCKHTTDKLVLHKWLKLYLSADWLLVSYA